MAYNPWIPYYGYYHPSYFYCHPCHLGDPCRTQVATPRPPSPISPSLLRGFESCLSAIGGASSRQSQFLTHISTNVTRNADAFAKSLPNRDGCKGNAPVASPTLDLSTLTQDVDDTLGPLVHLCRKAYPEPRRRLVIKIQPPRPPTPPPFKNPLPRADAIFSRWEERQGCEAGKLTFDPKIH